MGLFDYFAGGSADLTPLMAGRGRAEDYLERVMAGAEQPGARELATAAAYRRAQKRLRSQTAGIGGQQGAMAQFRTAAMMPVIAQQEAEAAGAARAADVEAQRGAERDALSELSELDRAYFLAKQQERQQKGAMRRAALGGLIDVGTKALGGM